jgi:diketogulonate reductase-like aldo/keto reductase
MTSLTIGSRIMLNNGVEMPVFGLGTFKSARGKETRDAVIHALRTGYRLLDTAAVYGNEEDVGEGIAQSSVSRRDIFVTTKLWNDDHGYDKTLTAFQRSLKRLNLKYIDLYLIHWPEGKLRNESWKAMEKLLSDGSCRAIGVSNFMVWHLRELLEKTDVVPAVNQVEFSPYLYQKELLEFCNDNGIRMEAYSPLTKGQKLNDPRLVEISTKYSRTPAQLLLRWALQKDMIVIPKSVRRQRIIENAGIFDFEIDDHDMTMLDSFNINLRTGWDPSTVP